jgi:hypothetical protein
MATIAPAAFNALTGNVTLQAANTITVAEPVVAAAASLALEAGNNIAANAPVTLTAAGGALTLAAGVATAAFTAAPGYDPTGATRGNISIAAAMGAATVRLSAPGKITQSAPVTAGTLALAGGSATLLAANAIGMLAASTVTGDLALATTRPLGVPGLVQSTAGNVYIASAHPGGIAVAGSAQAAGRVGLKADVLSLGGSLSGTTVEIAPFTQNLAMTLGGAGGLAVASGAGIRATTLRLGAVTSPGAATPVTTAGAITVAGFDAHDLAIDLRGTGALTQTGPLVRVAALTGQVAAAALADGGNAVATLGDFTAGDGLSVV